MGELTTAIGAEKADSIAAAVAIGTILVVVGLILKVAKKS